LIQVPFISKGSSFMELSLVHLMSLLVFVPSKEKLETKASDKEFT